MKKQRSLFMCSLIVLAFAASFLMGCSDGAKQAETGKEQPAAPAAASTGAATPEPESADDVIGAGSTIAEVRNETGYDIVEVRIKPSGSEGYAADNTFDGFDFKNGETVKIAFTAQAGTSSYDVLLVTSIDSKIAVRGIDLVGSKDIVMHYDEGIGYITYTDDATGEPVDNFAEAMDAEEDSAALPGDLESQMG